MDGGAWWAAVHGVAKSRTRLSDFPFTFHFRALEKEMVTHSSVLAWRIPGMGVPGGLHSMGSQSRTRLKRLSNILKNYLFSWEEYPLIITISLILLICSTVLMPNLSQSKLWFHCTLKSTHFKYSWVVTDVQLLAPLSPLSGVR